jgi:N-acetylglucosamine kinase-like BadF-type ATPase
VTQKQNRGAGRETWLLLVDAGATHTRAVIANPAGTVLGQGYAGPANAFATGERLARTNLLRAARGALASAGVRGNEIAAAVVGSAGVDFDGSGRAPIEAPLYHLLPLARLQVVTDSLIALEGALLGAPGVVIVSGTGSVILAKSPRGQVVKLGGWGPVFGDEGSAQWVARQALRAAARDVDGIGPATALTKMLLHHFGLHSFERIVDVIYSRAMTPAEMGALAPLVTRAARHGDRVALDIFRCGAQALVEQAVQAIRRLRLRRARVSYQGAMFQVGAILLSPLARALRELAPQAKLVSPLASPLGGAWLLGLRSMRISPTASAIVAFNRVCHV